VKNSRSKRAHGFQAMTGTIMDDVQGERVNLIEHQLFDAVKKAKWAGLHPIGALALQSSHDAELGGQTGQIATGADVIHTSTVTQ
jgi:hypothetical protein